MTAHQNDCCTLLLEGRKLPQRNDCCDGHVVLETSLSRVDLYLAQEDCLVGIAWAGMLALAHVLKRHQFQAGGDAVAEEHEDRLPCVAVG